MAYRQIEAEAFAAVAVASPRAVPAFLEYCRAEASGVINDHRDVALAIADALVGVGELSGAMVDEIIAGAISRQTLKIEIQRRADWARTCENAKRFQAVTPP
jgi:hypothetical protein